MLLNYPKFGNVLIYLQGDFIYNVTDWSLTVISVESGEN